jgi:hypothetical protein
LGTTNEEYLTRQPRSVLPHHIGQDDWMGSNPAISWTAPSAEQEGIHVHAVGPDGALIIDDTYGSVTIDGFDLDPLRVRLLMVQRALPQLTGRIRALTCAGCGATHLDAGSSAVHPTGDHACERCGRHQEPLVLRPWLAETPVQLVK